MSCEFESHHRFNLLTAFGKLLTTNVHPLDPGDDWVPGLGQYLPHPPPGDEWVPSLGQYLHPRK